MINYKNIKNNCFNASVVNNKVVNKVVKKEGIKTIFLLIGF